jgi:hypothetical protein
MTGKLVHLTDWLVLHTLSGHIDREGWRTVIKHFCAKCGASPTNTNLLNFDGCDAHFDCLAFEAMEASSALARVSKSGDSTNDQPNDNGTTTAFGAGCLEFWAHFCC